MAAALYSADTISVVMLSYMVLVQSKVGTCFLVLIEYLFREIRAKKIIAMRTTKKDKLMNILKNFSFLERF